MNPISVEHIGTTTSGGAGTAMNRLHQALTQESNIDSKITTLYENKYSYGRFRYLLNHLPIAHKILTDQLDRKFTPTWLPKLRSQPTNSDIVHLHWVSGYLSPNSVKKINSPIVWTLHDMWPLTGGCHYAKRCDGFSQGCGHCPALNSNSQNDLSNKQFRAYQRVLSEKKVQYISPSDWMTQQAENSSMIDDPIETIPNCLDTTHFSPVDQEVARSKLSIPLEKNVILTGGINLNDPIKGGDLLVEALHELEYHIDTEQTLVLQFGYESIDDIPFKTRALGWVDFDRLPLVYSSADVMAVPSRYESFGQTAAESLACGTPVVAFDTSGLRDVVIHKKSGLLANSYDCVDFMKNMLTLLEKDEKLEAMGEHARNYAVQSWSFEAVIAEYQSIYQKVIN